MLSFEALTGQTDAHVTDLDYLTVRCKLHPQVIPSFKILADAAKSQGFQLGVVSSFRGFHQQKAIWNAKALWQRPVLDANEIPIAANSIKDWQLVEAILRWSALPGTSRHHWGTDFDVVDLSALKPGYKIQLTQQEAAPEGIFGHFHVWLSEWLNDNDDVGFCRPYFGRGEKELSGDRYGVSQEPWHLSYRPVSTLIEQGFCINEWIEFIQSQDLELKRAVIVNATEIFERFVVRYWLSPPIR